MCPICKSNKIVSKYTFFDDRYGYPGNYRLLKCNSCEHQFTKNDFTENQIKDLYSNYYPRSNYKVENFRPFEDKKGFEVWYDGLNSSAYRHVPRNVRILDIGCGFCETIGYHVNRGCDAYGVETDENARRVAEKYNFNIKIGLFDPDDYEPYYFDYVTLDQVIEHMTDPIQTLNGIARILRPGGKVILSTPNAKGWGSRTFKELWINWHIPYHLQFFSKPSIKIAANMTGFYLDHYRTITKPNWLHYQFIHLISHPEIGVPSKFWSNIGNFSKSQKILIKTFDYLNHLKVFNIITIVMDLINMGDNQIMILVKE